MYVVWAFIVILLFLHFDLSEIIAFAHYTTASPLQKHAHYPYFTLSIRSPIQLSDAARAGIWNYALMTLQKLFRRSLHYAYILEL